MGVQANLWTEYVATDAKVEFMLLPRLMALSEIAWSRWLIKTLKILAKPVYHRIWPGWIKTTWITTYLWLLAPRIR
jgi:hypothetical protein